MYRRMSRIRVMPVQKSSWAKPGFLLCWQKAVGVSPYSPTKARIISGDLRTIHDCGWDHYQQRCCFSWKRCSLGLALLALRLPVVGGEKSSRKCQQAQYLRSSLYMRYSGWLATNRPTWSLHSINILCACQWCEWWLVMELYLEG